MTIEFDHGCVWDELVCINCSGSVTQQPCNDHYYSDKPDVVHLATQVAKLMYVVLELAEQIKELQTNKRSSYVKESKPKPKVTGGYKWSQ